MKRIRLHIRRERNTDPIRAARGNHALLKLFAPEVFALNAESDAVMAESAAFLRGLETPEENARQDRIAELERELARLKRVEEVA